MLQVLYDSAGQEDIMVAAVSRPKVLLVGRIEYAFEEWAEIEKLCEVVVC